MSKPYEQNFDFMDLVGTITGMKALGEKLYDLLHPQQDMNQIATPVPTTTPTPTKQGIGDMVKGASTNIIQSLIPDSSNKTPQKNANGKTGLDLLKEAIPEAKDILPNIAKSLNDEGILSPETLAYALGTAKHETENAMKPVREGWYNDQKYGYDEGFTGKLMAKKLNYSGGDNFYGRGLIQLTHDYNYKKYGNEIGVDLVKNPDKLLDPEISSKVLAKYFKDRGVADAVQKGDYAAARSAINPDKNADVVKEYSDDFLKRINDIFSKHGK